MIRSLKNYPDVRRLALLVLISVLALLVHGYHPGVEDAEIYLPGVKQVLNPALYPHNAGFFAAHARMTIFPNLIAASVRLTHIPLDWALLLWQLTSIFLLLLAAWHIARLAFSSHIAPWGAVALLASMLTLPVAGTALYIMDEYLTTRSFSTPAVLFILINAIERKFTRAALWIIFTALIHPLMVVFGLFYVIVLLWMEAPAGEQAVTVTAALLLPFGLFPPVTDAYRQALASRSYFFLLRWHWYEWLGIFAPLLLLWWFRQIARRQQLPVLFLMCSALTIFGLVFFFISLVITVPPQFANLAELQPMRSLHLLYILLFIFIGGLLADFVLKARLWRWIALFLPLCAGMYYAQSQTFPDTPHLELPGMTPRNPWVQAFLWVRNHTPLDAYFVLDPNYLALPTEDQHGFRAIAERSRLADNVKDSGAVTMFPALADTWLAQVAAQQDWQHFQASDFQHLHQQFGVDWVILQQPGVAGLDCPYHNPSLLVCNLK